MRKTFYENLKEHINKIEKYDNSSLLKREKANFSINGEVLSTEAQLVRERIRIINEFTFGSGEEYEFSKYNSLRSIIDALSQAIEEREYYDVEIIKKIIVRLELELGMDVQLMSTFIQMLKSKELVEDCEIIKSNVTFETLYSEYNERGKDYRKGR